jgi:uncharacterized membrane protein YeaQ/YmgE (transglycosylase-associated protein family)
VDDGSDRGCERRQTHNDNREGGSQGLTAHCRGIELQLSRHKQNYVNMNWLWFILIGLIAGFLAGAVVKGHGFGLLGNMVIGVIGAVLGGFLFGLLGLVAVGLIGNLVSAFAGAVVLLLLMKFVKGKGA